MTNLNNPQLSPYINKNINLIKDIFFNDEDLILKQFKNQYNTKINCCVFYMESMADNDVISKSVIKPITSNYINPNEINLVSYIENKIITSSKTTSTTTVAELVNEVIDGNTILFLDGYPTALIVESKGWITRAISEPTSETVVRGPREGYTECIITNISLLRRKVRSNKLKFRFIKIGTITQTKVAISYIEGLARDDIVDKIYNQLQLIKIDGILDAKYIQEYIDENHWSLFTSTYTTEKPDVTAAKLLEGRVAIIIDGTPVTITAPILFIELFQTGDDYYRNSYFSSVNRLLRILAFILTVSIPALYLSLVVYHQELIPTPLVMSIYASRINVPLPTIFELLGLLIVFEMLREAGSRIPSSIGQTLSIVGALVLGTAAVEARFVSAPIVIVIGMSGITSLINPALEGPSTFIKAMLILLSSVLGLYGYVIGMAFILLHLLKLKSCGIPYMASLTSYSFQSIKDTLIRVPRPFMKLRPKYLNDNNPVRTEWRDMDE